MESPLSRLHWDHEPKENVQHPTSNGLQLGRSHCYGANLALTANGDKFAIFRWSPIDANTFWVKSPGYNLRHVSYDPATGLGGVFEVFNAGTDVNSGMAGLASTGCWSNRPPPPGLIPTDEAVASGQPRGSL